MNFINHIALVLDASGSMASHKNGLIKATDELVKFLATRSTEMNQETRVTIYTFDDVVTCAIYEMDVLRLPSIASLYKLGGRTALIDATILSQDDLALQPQKYGDHAFLTYVLTDGQENASVRHTRATLAAMLKSQADNWTLGALVPDFQSKLRAQDYGFHKDNIALWDTASSTGAEEAVRTVTQSVDNYMQARATGVRSTKNLFQMDTSKVSAAAVKQLKVAPVPRGEFKLIPVGPAKVVLAPFIEANGFQFRLGQNYYQLSKVEKVQADKQFALVHKKTSEVYAGYEIRDFLGLPDHEVKVGPEKLSEYEIFVQSNSNNRHLMPGTKLLILNPAHKK